MENSIQSEILIKTLVKVSEKAAHISRSCRFEKELFELLVEEKTGANKNERFTKDFKTLADVLIQEMVRYELSLKFPSLAPRIKGEESNQFTNTLNQSVTLSVTPDQDLTRSTLEQVLNGDSVAASLLTRAVYSPVDSDPVHVDWTHPLTLSQLGIWIDPIDATFEYVAGGDGNTDDIHTSGLPCVCVLIGVYDLVSGMPVCGVINQPFYKEVDSKWQGRRVWGYCWEGQHCYQAPLERPLRSSKPTVVMSSTEEALASRLRDSYNVVFSAGAGYKLLLVILGCADFYVLSKPSTYKWDLCAPHAVLRAMGGGVARYRDVLESHNLARDLDSLQLAYNTADSRNSQGLLAYRDNIEGLEALVKVLRSD